MKTKAPLPPACRLCAQHEGLWRESDQGGMERCDCPRGRALAAGRPQKRRNFRRPGFDGRAAAAGRNR